MSTAASETTEQAARRTLAAAVGTAQVGVTPAPSPELNGLLLQLPGSAPVYLVINGLRRWVPDSQTFGNLFVSGANIIQDIGIGAVSEGAPLTSGAVLARADGRDATYLVSNGVKMWIPDPTIFNRYQFDTSKIKVLPPVVIDFLPNGPNIEGPHS